VNSPRIIRDRSIVADTWVAVAPDTPIPASGDVIVSLDTWQRGIAPRTGRVGVALEPHDDPAALAMNNGDIQALPLIAVQFPQFTDGRGYSIARLLRERHGYPGELRAVGDVGQDQLFYLARVGFNAFELKAGADLEAALRAFDSFSVSYQSAVNQATPWQARQLHSARRIGQ
jgi:uncharacterized protein (DUF934 family)